MRGLYRNKISFDKIEDGRKGREVEKIGGGIKKE